LKLLLAGAGRLRGKMVAPNRSDVDDPVWSDPPIPIRVATAGRKEVRCSISRIVPDTLIYVTSIDHPEKTYAVKLNTVLIEQPDGTVLPYRGEPLKEVGLVEGKEVTAWKLPQSDPPDILVVKAPCPSNPARHLADKVRGILPLSF
jgi:hypothetical protein